MQTGRRRVRRGRSKKVREGGDGSLIEGGDGQRDKGKEGGIEEETKTRVHKTKGTRRIQEVEGQQPT